MFEQVTDHAPWAARGLHKAISFNGRLIVVGGRAAGTYYGDAWESGNGVDWTQIASSVGVGQGSGLCSFGACVHNRRLYISNGLPDYSNQVVHSLDANAGVLDVVHAAFPGRYDGEMCSYDQRLWVMGGDTGNGFLNDVWASRDGVQWEQILATGHTRWTPRFDHRVVVHGGYMWLIGGVDDNGSCSDVWYSSDGFTWTQAISVAPFGAINDHGLVSYENRLVVVTGRKDSTVETKLWHSLDGTRWEGGADLECPPRGEFGLEVFDNRIYLLGGVNGLTNYNDVWKSKGLEF